MAVHDINSQRLFVDETLAPGADLVCSSAQTNYLVNVLRLGRGDEILVFNGRDGEWRCALSEVGKRTCSLVVQEQVRAQIKGPDVRYLFAPLKRARLDYMVQKAVEMGVSSLEPVLTRRTMPSRVNLERVRTNAIEAAEQCGILHLPEVAEVRKLDVALADWPAGRRLIFCDEAAPRSNAIATLGTLEPGPLAVLVGPEGGFDEDERKQLLAMAQTCAISLGPRIMRADTAAVAALALVNATLGDWK